MWLLRRGKWYSLLLGNIAIWLLFPSSPDVPDLTQELMQPLSWQLVFFGGMIIGFHWKQLTDWWNSLKTRTKRIVISSLLSVSLITALINIWVVFILPHYNIQEPSLLANLDYKLYIEFFDKERLPFARLALFATWFWSAFYLFRKFEPFIIRTVGWLLIPFGTNSLYVYTLHAFVIFFIHLWFQKGDLFFNLVVSVVIVALIRIAIHYRFLMKIIPR
jgi:fucose 4-O-acetylase-like acetyltransferase